MGILITVIPNFKECQYNKTILKHITIYIITLHEWMVMRIQGEKVLSINKSIILFWFSSEM